RFDPFCRRLESERRESRSGSMADDHQVQPALAVIHPSAKRRDAKLALPDAYKNQRGAIHPLDAVDLDANDEHRSAQEELEAGDDRGDGVSPVPLQSLPVPHEDLIRADGAGVQEQPVIDATRIQRSGNSFAGELRGFGEVLGKAEMLGKM